MRPSRRMRRFVAAALVIAAVAVLVASNGGGARAQVAPSSLRVTMVGDSVMLGARDQLLAQFAGMQVTFDAIENRSLLGATTMFQNAAATLGDVVVLDLGYNDSDDPAVFRARVDAAMSALSGVKRVIWLNQHEFTLGRAAMNAELTAAAARYPNLDVVDWNAEVAAHPADVYGDAIHLTPTGQTAMASLVRQHFDQYVASLTPTTTTTPPTTTTRAATAPKPRSAALADSSPSASTTPDWELAAGAVVIVAVVVALVGGTMIVLRRRRSVRR